MQPYPFYWKPIKESWSTLVQFLYDWYGIGKVGYSNETALLRFFIFSSSKGKVDDSLDLLFGRATNKKEQPRIKQKVIEINNQATINKRSFSFIHHHGRVGRCTYIVTYLVGLLKARIHIEIAQYRSTTAIPRWNQLNNPALHKGNIVIV